MPRKKYIVAPSDAECEQLEQSPRGEKHASRKITRVWILLNAVVGCPDEEIVQALGVRRVTVESVRQRFVERGLGALNAVLRLGEKPKLDANGEHA